MATISIYPNKKSWAGSPGTEWNRSSVGSSIKQAFSNTIKSTGTLKDSLASLKKQVDSVSSLVDVEDSSANLQAAKEREETKVGALSLAYDKIEEYMAKVERVDQDAQSEIRRLKENFYKRYYYLKPDCEKTKKELAKDWVKGKIEAFGEWIADIGEAIKNIVVGIVDWVKKNWKELVIGLAVIVVGAFITVLLSPAAGVAFWHAVGAVAFKGLVAAGVSAVVSGTISTGIAFYQSKKAGLSNEDAIRNALYAFGEGAANGFMTGAIGFAAGSIVNVGAATLIGKTNLLVGHSFIGSIGKSALFGAVTDSFSSSASTALIYWIENGTLTGAGDAVIKSMATGFVTGLVVGGIYGGHQYKVQERQDISFNEENLLRTKRGEQSANRSGGRESKGNGLVNQGDIYGDYMKKRLETTYKNETISEEISISSDAIEGKTRIDYTISDKDGKIIKGIEAKSSETATYQKGQLKYFANNDGRLVADSNVVGKKSIQQVGKQTIKEGTQIVTIRPSNFTKEVGVRLDDTYKVNMSYLRESDIGKVTQFNFLDTLDRIRTGKDVFSSGAKGFNVTSVETVLNSGIMVMQS